MVETIVNLYNGLFPGFFWIWIPGALLLILFKGDDLDSFWQLVAMALWPIVLVVGVLCLPFIVLGLLWDTVANVLRKSNKATKKKKEDKSWLRS